MKTAQNYYLLAILIVAMIWTRGPWMNHWFNLPNATLAAFFIAGACYRDYWIPALLFLTAGLIDYGAIQSGVSAWCITPAYGFLIPAYLCLWFAGTRLEILNLSSLKEGASMAALLFISSLAAFLISTGSFHLFSGRYPDASFVDRMIQSMQYMPGYIGNAFLYVSLVAGVVNSRPLFAKSIRLPFPSK